MRIVDKEYIVIQRPLANNETEIQLT